MTTISDRTVDDYLRRLERGLADLPSARRREILGEIEGHLAETLAGVDPEDTEAALRNALDRVGDPDDIAAEARERSASILPDRAGPIRSRSPCCSSGGSPGWWAG